EGAQHHGLPRSGLSGDDVEARCELQFDTLHKGQAFDAQGFDHRVPQWNFSRKISKWLRKGEAMSRTGWSLRRTETTSPSRSAIPSCPSTVSCTPLRERTQISIWELWGRTRGRCVRVWGQIGVSRNASSSGRTMGPPAERE